jgi:hypothetical protein
VTVAVEHGYRFLTRLAESSGGRRRPSDRGRSEFADSSASVGSAPRVSETSPVPAPAGTGAPTPAAQRPQRQPVPARPTATAPVSPATVRRWAQEQGIEVADRGPIPRSVMEQYRAAVVRSAPTSLRRTLRPPSSAA